MNICLFGSPDKLTFMQVVESLEAATIEMAFEFYLEFTDNNFLYLASDHQLIENAPISAA